MQKPFHHPLSVIQKYAVFFSGRYGFLDRDRRSPLILQINLQYIKQKQYVTAHHQHTALHPRRNSRRRYHKLIKQRRGAPVRQLPRHRRKQLSADTVLGNPLGIPAGMNYQNLFPKGFPAAFFLLQIFQDIQRSAAGTHTLTLRIREHHISCLRRQERVQQSVFDLFSIGGSLVFIGCRQNNHIPAWKGPLSERPPVILPGVKVALL